MNAHISSPSPVSSTGERPVLPAELLGKLATAYGDSDASLSARALAVDAAITFGADVKSIARDMADANRANPAVPVVVAATLGYAKFAGTVAVMVGTDLRAMVKRDKKLVADIVRAAKRAGIKGATAAYREGFHGVDGAFAREEIAAEVTARLLSTVLAAPAPAAPRSAAGMSDADTDATDAGPARGAVPVTEADVLAAMHAVTAYFVQGGAHSANIGSALAQLTAAATDARKRGRTETAKLAGATVETVTA